MIAAEGTTAEERERYVRMAAAAKRPRHLILLEVAATTLPRRTAPR